MANKLIQVATPKRFIVPVAAMVATGSYDVTGARAALAQPGVSLGKLIRAAVNREAVASPKRVKQSEQL